MRKCRQRIDTLAINAYLFRFAAALCSSKSRESSSVVVVLVSMCPPSFKLVLLNVNGRVFPLLLSVMWIGFKKINLNTNAPKNVLLLLLLLWCSSAVNRCFSRLFESTPLSVWLKRRKEDLSVCARARVSDDDDDDVTIDFKEFPWRKNDFWRSTRYLQKFCSCFFL